MWTFWGIFLFSHLSIQSLVYAYVDSWVFILDLKVGERMVLRLGKASGRYMAFVIWVSVLVCVWSISTEVKKMGSGPSLGA